MKLDFTKQLALFQRGYETEEQRKTHDELVEKGKPEKKAEIKPIETEYKGFRFRSRLEARWAVFFDACGVNWEYEPEGFELGNGLRYLPDFLLHDVSDRCDDNKIDLWVEVKGKLDPSDARKLREFNKSPHLILMVTQLPNGDSVRDLFRLLFEQYEDYTAGIAPWQFENIDGDHYAALPCISKTGSFSLIGSDYTDDIDSERTIAAYNKARQARFEHGEKPDVKALQKVQDVRNETLARIRQRIKEDMPIELIKAAIENYRLIDSSFEDGRLFEEDFQALIEFKEEFRKLTESPGTRVSLRQIAGEKRIDLPENIAVYKLFESKFSRNAYTRSVGGDRYLVLCNDFLRLLSSAFEEPYKEERKPCWEDFLLDYFGKADEK